MTLFELFFFFFRISAVTFGGGIVILGMVQLDQEKRKDIDPNEFADIVSLAASMPGPIAVSLSWLMGKHYKGLIGSFVAVLGAILPPFIIVLILSPLVLKYSHVTQVQGFFNGVLAGTGAIITVVVFKNVRKTLSSRWWNFVPFLLVIGIIGGLRMHPLLAMTLVIALQFAREKVISI